MPRTKSSWPKCAAIWPHGADCSPAVRIMLRGGRRSPDAKVLKASDLVGAMSEVRLFGRPPPACELLPFSAGDGCVVGATVSSLRRGHCPGGTSHVSGVKAGGDTRRRTAIGRSSMTVRAPTVPASMKAPGCRALRRAAIDAVINTCTHIAGNQHATNRRIRQQRTFPPEDRSN